MPAPASGRSPAGTYTFRVRVLGGAGDPAVWREIELKGGQTLEDLGNAIPRAFDFDDDHLWSFFLSGKPWDRATEYARVPDPESAGGRYKRARGLRVADAPPRREFLFLFDYGDEWHFGVKLARTGDVEARARYPRVVASHGEAPPQYPDLEDEEDDGEDWSDEDDWDDEDEEGLEAWVPGLALEPPSFPPVELASPEDLEAAAAAAPTVRRLRLLAEWTGKGRKFDAVGGLAAGDREDLAGLLGLADRAGVEQVVAWGRQTGLVRVRGGRLVPVKQQQHLLDEPLELLELALDTLPDVSADLLPVPMIERIYPDGFAGGLLDLLTLLYAEDEPVPADELAGHVVEEHLLESLTGLEAGVEELAGGSAGPDEASRAATVAEVGQVLGQLRDLGMIELSPRAGDGDTEGAEDRPGAGPGAGLVRLTPLGTWQVNLLLRAGGAVAPVVGEAAGKDVDELIEAVADYDEQAFKAELRAWSRERGDTAVPELARYVRGAPSFERRMLGLAGLAEAGPGAEAEVRGMLGDAALRPHAQMWLVHNGFEDERSLDP